MDISKIISTFIDKIKIILWPIFLLSVSLTFMPEKWLVYLSINDLVLKNKAWISGSLLISTAFIIVEIFLIIKSALSSYFDKKGFKKYIKKNLSNLSDTQNCIVHNLFADNTPAGMYLDMMHPEVNDLANKNIIYRSSNIGQLTTIAYSLTPIAYDVLSKSDSVMKKISEGYELDSIDKSVLGKRYW